MGDIAGANAFLAVAVLVVVGAFWGAWKDKPHVVFLCVVVGAAYAVFSVATFTWGLG